MGKAEFDVLRYKPGDAVVLSVYKRPELRKGVVEQVVTGRQGIYYRVRRADNRMVDLDESELEPGPGNYREWYFKIGYPDPDRISFQARVTARTAKDATLALKAMLRQTLGRDKDLSFVKLEGGQPVGHDAVVDYMYFLVNVDSLVKEDTNEFSEPREGCELPHPATASLPRPEGDWRNRQ